MDVDLATEAQLIGSHILDLLTRPGEPTSETLEECGRLFTTVREPVLQRWVECELLGYGGSGAVSLGGVLGVADDSPLAGRVRSYRQYVGRVRTQNATPGAKQLQVPYFFGEALNTLRHYRANADAIGVDFIEVELISSAQAADLELLPTGLPARTLEFPRYTFYRILSGLAVELEIVVRATLKRLAP